MTPKNLTTFLLALFLLASTSVALAGPTVYLPRFPIGETGSHTFSVDSPGTPLYPHWLYIKTRDSRTSRPVTWFEDAVLQFDILAPGTNKVLTSRKLPLRRWRKVDSDELRVLIWDRNSSDAFGNSYDIRVTVLVPSSRRFDKAQIQLGGVGR